MLEKRLEDCLSSWLCATQVGNPISFSCSQENGLPPLGEGEEFLEELQAGFLGMTQLTNCCT